MPAYSGFYSFPPAARVDEYIAVMESPDSRIYGKVIYLEPIPVYKHTFVLGAGQTLYDQELQYIEVGSNEALQFRISVEGPARFHVKLPRAIRRFTLRRTSGWIDDTIAPYPRFPAQTEMALLENAHIFVDVENRNAEHPEKATLYVTGWRLVYEPVTQPPQRYTVLIVQGFAPRA